MVLAQPPPTSRDNFMGIATIATSADGEYLCLLLGLEGGIGVYEIGPDGGSLSLLQETSGPLPELNTQGLVSASGVTPIPLPPAV